MKTGAELISEERGEHFTKHGRDVLSDIINNPNGELLIGVCGLINDDEDNFPSDWDSSEVDYMLSKPRIDQLVMAGAMIAAEIDRLNLIQEKSRKEL